MLGYFSGCSPGSHARSTCMLHEFHCTTVCIQPFLALLTEWSPCCWTKDDNSMSLTCIGCIFVAWCLMEWNVRDDCRRSTEAWDVRCDLDFEPNHCMMTGPAAFSRREVCWMEKLVWICMRSILLVLNPTHQLSLHCRWGLPHYQNHPVVQMRSCLSDALRFTLATIQYIYI